MPELALEVSPKYLVFADYSIWAHGYAIHCDGADPVVVIVGSPGPIRVASSFSDFLDKYLNRPSELFRPPSGI